MGLWYVATPGLDKGVPSSDLVYGILVTMSSALMESVVQLTVYRECVNGASVMDAEYVTNGRLERTCQKEGIGVVCCSVYAS